MTPSPSVESFRAASENLRNHQFQLDQDGVMVGVSRQALEEVLSALALLPSPEWKLMESGSAQSQPCGLGPADLEAGLDAELSDLERAISIAALAHAGQLDKGAEPYILHPLRVMLALETEEDRIAAVLHDVLEDCPAWTPARLVAEGFSPNVITAVMLLTRRDETYEAFIERLAPNPIARRVKIADLRDNMNLSRIPHPTYADKRRQERYGRALTALGVQAEDADGRRETQEITEDMEGLTLAQWQRLSRVFNQGASLADTDDRLINEHLKHRIGTKALYNKLSPPPPEASPIPSLGGGKTGSANAILGPTPKSADTKAEPSGPVNCTHVLRRKGGAYPRTCERCGVGPCPFYNNDGTVKS